MNKSLQPLLRAFAQDVDVSDVAIKDLRLDSRKVTTGDLFFAVQGQSTHGISYLDQVVAAGAVAVLTDKEVEHEVAIPVIHVPKLSTLMGDVAHQFYGSPSEQLKVLAVTGTNGKTSVAWFLAHALNQQGQKAAYLGTLGAGFLNALTPLLNTTPSVLDVHRLMASFIAQGATHVCMEVSSHALDQGRIDGVFVHQALFTNLSRDHLDYHLNMEQYAEAKFQLFDLFCSQSAIFNADDVVGQEWLKRSINSGQVLSYGIKTPADMQAKNISSQASGLHFDLCYENKKMPIDSPLMGLFNVENLLLVASSLSALGVEIEQLPQLIQSLQAVPGRMNVVENHKPIGATWVVDYAHTPDALASVLKSLRHHVAGQLFCIFGCGGDRDKGKRALMGQAAEQHADVVILTDDNPRFESPDAIVSGILAGMSKPHEVIHQRKQAIKHVMHMSQAGDVVLVAGKGHEDYQDVNGVRNHYNDEETIQNLLGVAA